MTILKIAALFLICRLGWIWVDLCGTDLGLGQSLPFCHECSAATTFWRIVLLTIAIVLIIHTLNKEAVPTEIYGDDNVTGRSVVIHWHHIALLIAIISYPLWVRWIDSNTTIPGPDSTWIFKDACINSGFKGSILWGIEMFFIVCGFQILLGVSHGKTDVASTSAD